MGQGGGYTHVSKNYTMGWEGRLQEIGIVQLDGSMTYLAPDLHNAALRIHGLCATCRGKPGLNFFCHREKRGLLKTT